MIGPRSSEWNEPPLITVMHEHGLHRAEHRWCAFGLSVSSELQPHERSNHAYVTATSWTQQSHDCTCDANITHVLDKLGREFSRSRKSEAYKMFSVKLLTTLLGAGSLRLPDSQGIDLETPQGRSTDARDGTQDKKFDAQGNPSTSNVQHAHQPDQEHSRQDPQDR